MAAPRNPPLVVKRTIAEHLEILRGPLFLRLRIVETVHHADALDRLLLHTIEFGRRGSAGRPARLGVVAADDGVDRVAVAVEAEERAGRHHLADRDAGRDVSDGIRGDGYAEPRAQRREPFELLALLEPCGYRGIADDADETWIADLAGAHGVELCALAGVVQVPFDAGEKNAGEPVVAGLGAADRSVELARGAGREQPGSARRVAEDGVGIGLAGAVTDGAAEIGPGPTPGRHDRRLVERQAFG